MHSSTLLLRQAWHLSKRARPPPRQWLSPSRHLPPELGRRQRCGSGRHSDSSLASCHQARCSCHPWPRPDCCLRAEDAGRWRALPPAGHRLCACGYGIPRRVAWGSTSPGEKDRLCPGPAHWAGWERGHCPPHLPLLPLAPEGDSSPPHQPNLNSCSEGSNWGPLVAATSLFVPIANL